MSEKVIAAIEKQSGKTGHDAAVAFECREVCRAIRSHRPEALADLVAHAYKPFASGNLAWDEMTIFDIVQTLRIQIAEAYEKNSAGKKIGIPFSTRANIVASESG